MPSLRRAHRPMLIAAVLGAFLVVSGCAPSGPEADPESSETASETPTPSPSVSEEPHAPEVGQLVLTPDGMGTLVIGVAPSAEPTLQMLEMDPAACADVNTGFGAGVEPGDPEAIRWVPVAAYNPAGGFAPWSVDVHDGILMRIDVFDSSIPTDRGIRIGDSAAAALAAYPEAAVVEEWGTDVIVMPGTHGVTHIEIAREPGADLAGYWEGRVDTVVYLRTVDLAGGVFSVAASENIAGGCL